MEVGYLDKLPVELVLKIFSYVDFTDLCRLNRTCKRFEQIISNSDDILLKGIIPLVTNQKCSQFSSRCFRKLRQFEKLRISHNWTIGRYVEKDLLFSSEKYLPCLHMNDKFLWFSRNKYILCYRRNENGIDDRYPVYVLHGSSSAEVRKFQIKGNWLICGLDDGAMWLRDLENDCFIFDGILSHLSDVCSVDINSQGDIIASGGRDNMFSLWKVDCPDDGKTNERLINISSFRMEDTVWKVTFCDEGRLVAVGTGGKFGNPLVVYDTETRRNLHNMDVRGGILDIKMDISGNTLWSCGYDSCVHRWDLRSGTCVKFEDPYDSALYCLEHDYCNTLMAGCQMYGRVCLWDSRFPKWVQVYFTNENKHRNNWKSRSSPVYSLSFDSEFLFTATDQNLNVFNYSVYDKPIKNYSDNKLFSHTLYCCDL